MYPVCVLLLPFGKRTITMVAAGAISVFRDGVPCLCAAYTASPPFSFFLVGQALDPRDRRMSASDAISHAFLLFSHTFLFCTGDGPVAYRGATPEKCVALVLLWVCCGCAVGVMWVAVGVLWVFVGVLWVAMRGCARTPPPSPIGAPVGLPLSVVRGSRLTDRYCHSTTMLLSQYNHGYTVTLYDSIITRSCCIASHSRYWRSC